LPQTSRPGQLLVADDNENNRDMLVRILTRQGHRSEVAHNGREALDKLRAGNFDLLLLDIMMPEVDGFQVLTEMKADPVLREVPVIVLSAIHDMEAIIRCIKMGADDYLPKPIDLTLLRARVGASIEKKRLHEREKQLLLNILPPRIAEELRENGSVEPKHLDEIAILFTDFVHFSALTTILSAAELVSMLDRCFTAFDRIVERRGLEKLKTIGDSYMLVGGLEGARPSYAVDAVLAAFEMVEAVKALDVPRDLQLAVRVGIHAGPVVAGVVGVHKFAFDVWGQSVNYAARLEACSEPNRINLSTRMWELVKDTVECEYRGQIETKDKRLQDMYFANRVKAG
jgi:adenylate cyclase